MGNAVVMHFLFMSFLEDEYGFLVVGLMTETSALFLMSRGSSRYRALTNLMTIFRPTRGPVPPVRKGGAPCENVAQMPAWVCKCPKWQGNSSIIEVCRALSLSSCALVVSREEGGCWGNGVSLRGGKVIMSALGVDCGDSMSRDACVDSGIWKALGYNVGKKSHQRFMDGKDTF